MAWWEGVPVDPRARLAELVAALSLGVDLGFGQPMEHVLRQCLIALRLADHAGLGEQDRMAVYYTALLVNVGCHADAHEQAKWFGDDITLKSGKYAHELGSVRGALATMRLVGAGNPPLHRFRVGLEFAFSGHRQLDGMISQHARLARTLAGQLEPARRGARGGRRRLRAMGRARLAGHAEGRRDPGRGQDRPARRVHGGGAPGRRHGRRHRAGPQAGGPAVRPGPGRAAVLTARTRSSAAWTRPRPGGP